MSTGGRVFPSITGGGLTSAAQAVLDAQIGNRERALQSRQLDLTETAQALNQLVTLSNFLPPGTMLGDLGQAGMDLFSRAFRMDVTGLEALELNPRTFATALDAQRLQFLDTPEAADLLLPSLRATLGLEPSTDVASVRDLEAQMRFGALTDILESPELAREFVSRTLGQDPVKLRIPGVPGEIEFESTTAANIYAQFLLAREQFTFRLDLDADDPIQALITETQAAVLAAGHSVSSTALMRIFGIYNQAVAAGDISLVQGFLNDVSIEEGEKLAMQFLLGSIGAGENAFLQSLPPQLRNFLLIGKAVRQVLSPEDAEAVLQGITQALDPEFTAVLDNPLFGGLRLEVGGERIGEQNPLLRDPEAEAAAPVTDPFDVTTAPEQILIEEARRSLADGSSTREELIGLIGEELVNKAVPIGELDPDVAEAVAVPEGGILPSAVPIPFKADARRLNTLIRLRERTQGELALANLDAVIGRLRDRIARGMRIGG